MLLEWVPFSSNIYDKKFLQLFRKNAKREIIIKEKAGGKNDQTAPKQK